MAHAAGLDREQAPLCFLAVSLVLLAHAAIVTLTLLSHHWMALFNGSIGQRNHFAELQELIDAFRQNYLDTARIYFDPNPPYQAHAFPPSEFPHPPIISIVLGEICYNPPGPLLITLIYELAAYDAKAPQDGTPFLITGDTPQIFARDKASKLKGLSSEHVAGIEQLQPYNGCHWIKVLQTISNPDKHRSLPPRGSVLQRGNC